MATQEQLIVSLYMTSMLVTLIALIAGGILIWFRTAVFNEIKLRKLIRKGYIICRLKRIDKTEKEAVLIPDTETNGVRFPGVEGLYTLDDASVILKNRKYPVYEWREGETAPINHQIEYITTEVNCPHCTQKFPANVMKPKSIAPSVLDNLILKIKTLTQMAQINKLFLIILIALGIIAIGLIVNWFFVDDFKKRIGEILAPTIKDACTQAIINTKNSVVA